MQLHQILAGASPHDAITDHALRLQLWLRELGFQSEIYAGHIETGFRTTIRPLHSYRDRGELYLIYHHSLGSDVVDTVLQLGKRLVLIYHNVTPPAFFAAIDPAKAAASRRGLAQLAALRERTAIGVGVSSVNVQVLHQEGFAPTAVLPIVLDEALYQHETNSEIVAEKGGDPMLLFVGRLAPNKRQEDLIKLLYAYRQIEPTAQLVLLGSHWSKSYVNWIADITHQLGVQDGVLMPGLVSQADLVSYYRIADLYVSMSEHEGFGKPYIECMYHQLPILAYGEAGTADTLGMAGIKFNRKDYPALAELVAMVVNDRPFQERIVGQQLQRLDIYRQPAVRRKFVDILGQLPGIMMN